ACSGGAAGAGASQSPSTDYSVLLRDQIHDTPYTNLYDLVRAVRPNWMRVKGTDSFNAPTTVQVYMDNARIGGIEQLRSIGTATIYSVKYYDGITASARWGLDHGQGVIFIVSAR
ncbi:MAG: hypothetical protein ABIZ91_10980, partial [Gemmatimonadaceae bacterium]